MGVRSPGPIYYHSWQKPSKVVALSPPKTWGRGAHPKLQRPFQSQAASAPQIRTFVRHPGYRPLSFHSRSTGTNPFQHRIEPRAQSGHLDKNGAHGGRGGFPATNQPPTLPTGVRTFSLHPGVGLLHLFQFQSYLMVTSKLDSPALAKRQRFGAERPELFA